MLKSSPLISVIDVWERAMGLRLCLIAYPIRVNDYLNLYLKLIKLIHTLIWTIVVTAIAFFAESIGSNFQPS